MSIKIHHGPNGSYKTSGAIQDDAVPALKDGRVIITNVRGFTLEPSPSTSPRPPARPKTPRRARASSGRLSWFFYWHCWPALLALLAIWGQCGLLVLSLIRRLPRLLLSLFRPLLRLLLWLLQRVLLRIAFFLLGLYLMGLLLRLLI